MMTDFEIQIDKLRMILALLIFAVDLVILSIGLLQTGTIAWVIDGFAALIFVLIWVVGAMTE